MDMRLFKILIILQLAVSAWAGPLDSGDVSSSAKWVIHLDGEALWASELGAQLMEIAHAPELQAKLGAIKMLFGTDLTKDIHSITLYGPDGNDTQAVALVKGRMDRQKLVSLAVLSPRYEKMTAGESVIHRWGDGGDKKTQYMGFASDDKLVMSQSRSVVEKALDVLAGKAGSAAGTERFSAIKRGPDKAFLVACAEDLSHMTRGQAHAAMLQRSSELAICVGQTGGFFDAKLQLQTDSPEAAVQIETMGRGILAMMQFQEDKFSELKPLLAGCSLESRDKRVEFAFRYPLDKLMLMIKSRILGILALKNGQK